MALMRFQLAPSTHADVMLVWGTDQCGRRFFLSLDRVWAANLCVELNGWLSGDDPTV